MSEASFKQESGEVVPLSRLTRDQTEKTIDKLRDLMDAARSMGKHELYAQIDAHLEMLETRLEDFEHGLVEDTERRPFARLKGGGHDPLAS